MRPRYLDDYAVLALHAETFVENLPTSIDAIEQREDKDDWMQAVNEEIDALVQNQTWELMQLPEGKRMLNNK